MLDSFSHHAGATWHQKHFKPQQMLNMPGAFLCFYDFLFFSLSLFLLSAPVDLWLCFAPLMHQHLKSTEDEQSTGNWDCLTQ